jgi:peptide/nickel transport system substrate-binding protein
MPHDEPTLRLSGPGELGPLDPVRGPRPPAARAARLFSRQLFTYSASPDLRDWRAVAPVPDLAAQVPSIYNAGLGASYTSYVVHLRPGIRWDTTPPRPVTAPDVVRGFKRLGNPLARPAALPFFTSTIRGMAEFCAGYAAAMPASPTAAELAGYQNSHDITGLLVLDDETLVFELIRPALDFVDLLALPCATPAPREYDDVVPDSPEFRRGIRSTGPYRPEPAGGRTLRLTPNPVWRPESDPVRGRHFAAVEITSEPSTSDSLGTSIRAGAADLAWGARPATAAPGAPGHDLGHALDPYLVFNTRTLADVPVRRVLAAAIDKAALADDVAALGTGTAIRVADTIVPPGNDAHQDPAPVPAPEPAPVPDDLTLVHPDTEAGRLVASRCTEDLRKAGVAVAPVALGESALQDLLENPDRAAEWDVAVRSWAPGWLHHNARAFLQPMVRSAEGRGTANHGGYRNAEVDALIDAALAADEDREAALAAWREAERVALADAPVVPLLFQVPSAPEVTGTDVTDAVELPALGYSIDLATVRPARSGPTT